MYIEIDQAIDKVGSIEDGEAVAEGGEKVAFDFFECSLFGVEDGKYFFDLLTL